MVGFNTTKSESEDLMNMVDYVAKEEDPKALRFSQYFIPKFIYDHGKQVSVHELLDKLKRGERTPESFGTMKVSNSAPDGQLYCKNNVILWLFRMANIQRVKVMIYSKPLERAPPPMMYPEFLPKVRGTTSGNKDSSDEYESESSMNMPKPVPFVREEDPKNIRFTQDSIRKCTHFRGQKVLLADLLEKLKRGELIPEDFDMLEVSDRKLAKDGQMYSNDNRRLWLFREANIQLVKVKVYSKRLTRAPLPMMYPEFLPEIREHKPGTSDGYESWEDPSN